MKYILFDFNGTLFQDTELHFLAWGRFCEDHGLPYSRNLYFSQMVGPSNRDILAALFPDRCDDTTLERLSEEKETHYRQIIRNNAQYQQLTPGASELLDWLISHHVSFGLVTSSSRENCEFYLDVLGLKRWFDFSNIFYASREVPGKPDPAIYRLAMKSLRFSPEETLVVEDSSPGLDSALASGAGRIVAIDTTIGYEACVSYRGVYAVIHDFHGFERYL